MQKTAIKMTSVDMDARKGLDFSSGDTVRVWSKILEEKAAKKGDKKGEGAKFRLQAFEGLVLARKHGGELGGTFTVRKVASGVGVERIFPIYSPMIDKIEIVKKSGARRSKLYYVRNKAVKDIRKKMKSVAVSAERQEAAEAVAEKAAE